MPTKPTISRTLSTSMRDKSSNLLLSLSPSLARSSFSLKASRTKFFVSWAPTCTTTPGSPGGAEPTLCLGPGVSSAKAASPDTSLLTTISASPTPSSLLTEPNPSLSRGSLSRLVGSGSGSLSLTEGPAGPALGTLLGVKLPLYRFVAPELGPNSSIAGSNSQRNVKGDFATFSAPMRSFCTLRCAT